MTPEVIWVFSGCFFVGCLGIAMAFKHQMSCNKKDQSRAIAETRIETKIDGLSHIFTMVEPLIRADERTKIKLETLDLEVGKIRDMRHEIIEKVSTTMASNHIDIMERTREMIDRVRQ